MSEVEATANSSSAFPSIAIDEEGYPMFGDIRIADAKVGSEVLGQVSRHESGAFYTELAGVRYLVEAFDQPYVIDQIEMSSLDAEGGLISATLPYGKAVQFRLTSLRLDEWDRLHGYTANDIPFVLSRKAQATLFNGADEIWDDSISLGGRIFSTPPVYGAQEEASSAGDVNQDSFWTAIYKGDEEPGWNLHKAAPALVDVLPRIKLPKSRVLVLGCGEGFDAHHFAEAGHIVTAIDFSEEALSRAKKRFGGDKIQWVQADALAFQPAWADSFDVVFDHTFYCAIDPTRRGELADLWFRYLTPGGQLLGIFFAMDRPSGPPFGGSEWEMRQRLQKRFQFLLWGRVKDSPPARLGKEFLVLARKSLTPSARSR